MTKISESKTTPDHVNRVAQALFFSDFAMAWFQRGFQLDTNLLIRFYLSLKFADRYS